METNPDENYGYPGEADNDFVYLTCHYQPFSKGGEERTSRVFFKKIELKEYTYMARRRPEPENNPKFRPETRPEYSQTRPKPVGSGQVGRVFGWAGSLAQS